MQVLRFGCSYEAIADSSCSATTIRSRRDEWIAAGIFARLKRIALEAYDRIAGLVLEGSSLSAPAAMPATRHPTFRCALTPHGPPGRTCSVSRSVSTARSASAITGTSPGPRHEIRVIERCVCPGQAMQQSHLQGVLSNETAEASDTPIVSVQRAPFTLPRPESSLFGRWIEA